MWPESSIVSLELPGTYTHLHTLDVVSNVRVSYLPLLIKAINAAMLRHTYLVFTSIVFIDGLRSLMVKAVSFIAAVINTKHKVVITYQNQKSIFFILLYGMEYKPSTGTKNTNREFETCGCMGNIKWNKLLS